MRINLQASSLKNLDDLNELKNSPREDSTKGVSRIEGGKTLGKLLTIGAFTVFAPVSLDNHDYTQIKTTHSPGLIKDTIDRSEINTIVKSELEANIVNNSSRRAHSFEETIDAEDILQEREIIEEYSANMESYIRKGKKKIQI